MRNIPGMRIGGRAGTGQTLVALLTAAVLLLAACGTRSIEDEGMVTMARASWDSGHMQAAIYAQLIEELGYEVTDPADNTRTPNGFYPALATGQYDLWVNGWFPVHNIYLKGEEFTGQFVDLPIEPVGWQVPSGALQGYMVDKATADELGITSMNDVIANAGVFDQDGDGRADLIGCDKGWGCNTVIDTHIAEFGWGGQVEQVVGDYNDLARGVEERVKAGQPALFYAWTPNWTLAAMTPGEDVVWLQSPSLPDDEGTMVNNLQGCAWDPCDLGWAVSSIRAVANTDFLDANPQIRALLEAVTIPLADIANQNAKMATEMGYSEDRVWADAAEWIASNRATVDGWLANARAAG